MWETIKAWAMNQGLTLATLALKTVIIAVIGILVIRLVNKVLSKILEKSKMDRAAHGLVLTLVKTVLAVLLLLILASGVGIDITGIVALASVVTLAISLSLQDMLSNIVGGFTLLYTDPFSAGDYVEVGGQSGTVQEVGMTYTKLVTPDNKIVYIPNKAVVSAEIVNYTVTGTRRISIDISASYDAPPQKVIDALVSCVDPRFVLEGSEAPYAVLTGYGESVINYSLRFWVKGDDFWDATFATNQKILQVFADNGVEMSYPHLNVHLDK
ncbi:MAG: mechanosensitive ion channel [Ruminococcaceae bacterium]|nr:mechanosensitive ion channel [Oscillospiraceae bacterium]